MFALKKIVLFLLCEEGMCKKHTPTSFSCLVVSCIFVSKNNGIYIKENVCLNLYVYRVFQISCSNEKIRKLRFIKNLMPHFCVLFCKVNGVTDHGYHDSTFEPIFAKLCT